MVALAREKQQLRLILLVLCWYNPSQNILKILLSSVFMESLIVDFNGFSILNFSFGREIGHWAIPACNFEILKVTSATKQFFVVK